MYGVVIMLNKLTERLLAEGYTKENHPDYVEWSHWDNFEYVHAHLSKMVWETPCGLLKAGMEYNFGSHMGIDYCPENNNPRCGCPYYDEKPCAHRIDTKLMGWNCIYHQTDRPYDFNQSVEKIWKEWDIIKITSWREATKRYGYCACMVWDRPKRKYIPQYDVNVCINNKCRNEICAITKMRRNLKKVNIYYDILRQRRYKKGLFEGLDWEIVKGVKKFESAIARTDAEIWLKQNSDKFEPRLTRDDRSELHFSEYHGKDGYSGYDWCEYTVTVQNVRVEHRESRDLMQDLLDAKEGIKVSHESDLKKQAAQAKKDRKEKRNQAKAWRIVKNLKQMAGAQEELLKQYAVKKLKNSGFTVVEQLTLF